MDILSKLVINADDFGSKPSVNEAIIDSFNQGFINSTTLMANMPATDEAIELAHRNKITDKIGVHLVITEGEPLTEEIKNLRFLFNGNLPLKERLKHLFYPGNHNKKLIYNEYAAQIEKILAGGIKITHLDTHHQVHDMLGIVQIIISLLKKYKIPSMRILNNMEHNDSYLKNKYRQNINKKLRKQKINYTDYMGNQLDFIQFIKKYSARIQKKQIEIMVHPDLDNTGKITDTINTKAYNFDFVQEAKSILNY